MSLEGLQLGRYRLIRLIGSGGMGEVYLATDTLINRQVAIKVIRTEATPYPHSSTAQEVARLFQREARAIASLDHPHILPLFDYGEEAANNGMLTYMVMPLREEGTLNDWLRRSKQGPLSPEQVADIIEQAASALQYAHNHQIIHQDVKPSNFLIRTNQDHPDRPDLLLADFGIARLTSATSQVTHGARGTPNYMAPEQWSGEPVPASDQYALAVMAYELLAGRPPFQGNMGQVMYAHMQTPPQSLLLHNPHIPAPVDIVILRALAKEPAQRYPSVSEFARAFRLAAQSGTYATVRQGDQYAEGDFRATLAISPEDARSGTQRPVMLPGGRRENVTIPAGVRDGQIIRQDHGPAGTLLLRIAIVSGESTALSGQPTVTGKGAASNTEHAHSTVATSQEQQPVPPRDSLPSANRGNEAGRPVSGNNPHSNFTAPNIQQAQLPYQHSADTAKAALPRGKAFLLVGLLILVVVATGGGIFLFTQQKPAGDHAHSVTPPVATTAPTTNAQTTVATTPVSTTTAPPVKNPVPNPYPPRSGTQVLDDPLQDNSRGYQWGTDNDANGNCSFAGQAYHITMSLPGVEYCAIKTLVLTDFAYQIQMSIIKGKSGGVIFRSTQGVQNFYFFSIRLDGSYNIYLYTSQDTAPTSTLRSGTSAAIHKGLNQPNAIAVVAQGDKLDFYVNNQHIDTVNDKTYSSGYLGAAVRDELDLSNSTTDLSAEVAFTNARVWKL